MNNCLFCSIENDLEQKIVLSNQYCMFLQKPQEILIGSGVIVPKRHRKTVFDLSEDEWNATFDLLKEVKVYIDNKYKPDGYNIGMNLGKEAGQSVMHLHVHLIPRYKGDVENPRGGVRGVIPEKQNY